MTASDNLSADQFGNAHLSEHHARLGMAAPQVGAILGMWKNEPPVATGKRVTLTPDVSVVPNQPHVNVGTVAGYMKKPSKKPIAIVKNPNTGDLHVLDGHNRIAADRLMGRNTRAEYWESR